MLYQPLYSCMYNPNFFLIPEAGWFILQCICCFLGHPRYILSPHTAQRLHKQVKPQKERKSAQPTIFMKCNTSCMALLSPASGILCCKRHNNATSGDKMFLFVFCLFFLFKPINGSVMPVSLKYGLLPVCQYRKTALRWVEWNLESFRSSWEPNLPNQ